MARHEDTPVTASPGYALHMLERALETAASHADPEVRRRAMDKAEAWRAILDGIATGQVTVGSRTPVADTPAWVTLEVGHGGFATGRYLAESELQDHERELLAQLPAELRGESNRARLNAWYLGDAGQNILASAVRQGTCRIELPEEGALPVIAWLLQHRHAAEALELISAVQPLMHRLRFYPQLTSVARPTASLLVHREPAAKIATTLRDSTPNPRIRAMNQTLAVWNPLFDRLVALWLETVEGRAPYLERDDSGALARPSQGQPIVAGGWPCREWPPGWPERRAAWLAEHRAALATHHAGGKHHHRRSNFTRLAMALEQCPVDSRDLRGSDVASIRRALASATSRHGAPGSERHRALREEQTSVAARPLHASIAQVVAARLEEHAAGLGSLDPIALAVQEGENPRIAPGTAIPRHFVTKAARALEAPIEELVERGVIPSGEVLAQVLPQITSQVAAAGIADPGLRALFTQIYAAFRRRRSLLLLNLEHQVQLDELPWVAALTRFRQDSRDTRAQARQTLEEVTSLALFAFPQTILPNPLVRELGALAERAGLTLPLVEEVAADIFMGSFTQKWQDAADIAARVLEGRLYARYYDLPPPRSQGDGARFKMRWGTKVAVDFAHLCRMRANEAGSSGGRHVTRSGAILEQSQILTTHNLAVLVHELGLDERIQVMAPALVDAIVRFVVARQTQSIGIFKARLQMLKNTAYAWRQAIFFLSYCSEAEQRAALERVEAMVRQQRDQDWVNRFWPAVKGLRLVIEGGRFDAHGRAHNQGVRFLGWSVGRHWMLP